MVDVIDFQHARVDGVVDIGGGLGGPHFESDHVLFVFDEDHRHKKI